MVFPAHLAPRTFHFKTPRSLFRIAFPSLMASIALRDRIRAAGSHLRIADGGAVQGGTFFDAAGAPLASLSCIARTGPACAYAILSPCAAPAPACQTLWLWLLRAGWYSFATAAPDGAVPCQPSDLQPFPVEAGSVTWLEMQCD